MATPYATISIDDDVKSRLDEIRRAIKDDVGFEPTYSQAIAYLIKQDISK